MMTHVLPLFNKRHIGKAAAAISMMGISPRAEVGPSCSFLPLHKNGKTGI
jgi:hypothetical protein